MFISTSRTRRLYLRRPTGQFVLNKDSLQAQGLVAWWPGHTGGNKSTLLDMGGGGFHGTISSTLSVGFDGLFGPVLNYNNSGASPTQNVTIANVLSNRFGSGFGGDIAFFLWVYGTTISGFSTLVDTTNRHLSLWVGSNFVGLGGTSGGYGTHTAQTGQWQLWGASTNAAGTNAMYVWKNGISVAAGTSGGTYTDTINLGDNPSTGGTRFGGYRADFRIYKGIKGAFDSGSNGVAYAMYDPASRWDLYYPIGQRTIFIASDPVVNSFSQQGSGRLALTGLASVVDSMAYSGVGSIRLTGLASVVDAYIVSGLGQLTFTGLGGATSAFGVMAAGALRLTGLGDLQVGYNYSTSGSLLLFPIPNNIFTYEANGYLTFRDRGLMAWWRLDEGAGTLAYDSSLYGRTGTAFNSPTWVTGNPALRFGSPYALDFDGLTEFVTASAVGITNPTFTISLWVKARTLSEGRPINSQQGFGRLTLSGSADAMGGLPGFGGGP